MFLKHIVQKDCEYLMNNKLTLPQLIPKVAYGFTWLCMVLCGFLKYGFIWGFNMVSNGLYEAACMVLYKP